MKVVVCRNLGEDATGILKARKELDVCFKACTRPVFKRVEFDIHS